MAKVLAISSHVVRGQVGLAATVPALQLLGHEVWALPTVLLASRPGLGRLERQAISGPELARMLCALEADGCWPQIDAVFTGYFPSPDSVAAAAEAIASVKAARPTVEVFVDPIVGDSGRLYVAEATAEAIRDRLLPLATIATPNLFELQWLAQSAADNRAIEAVGASLGIPSLVVTSAEVSADSIETLLVVDGRARAFQSPRHPDIPNGTGDIFAGLLLGHLLKGHDQETSLVNALGALDGILAESKGRPVLQLSTLMKGAG